jgi:hypothetical protein
MASTKLSRTAGTASNTYKATISAWVKRATTGTEHRIFTGWGGTNEQSVFTIGSDDRLVYQEYSGSFVCNYQTNRLLRDTSAFYHLMVAIDTTLSTATDRVKIYINGLEQRTNGGFSTDTQIAQNTQLFLSNYSSGQSHNVGARDSENYFDGLMTHIHLIDGTQYAATDFGETDSTSGIWKPKTAPSVTYGTNGFFLKMENSGAMGTDSSGNSNTFTVSGTLTQNVDTPSNVFATINPLYNQTGGQGVVLANGNTRCSYSPNSSRSAFGTIAIGTGKYYFEAKLNTVGTAPVIGIVDMDWSDLNSASGYGYHDFALNFGYDSAGGKVSGGSSSSFGDSFTANDIIGVAIDKTNNKLYFSKNGVWQNSGDPTSGATGTGSAFDLASDTLYTSACRIRNGGDWSFNFGQGYFGTTAVASAGTSPSGGGIFEYDCPSGYQALCTKGINSF